ncbi:MAG: hypothetical protein AAGA54_28965 [Myxococcota bacterium]
MRRQSRREEARREQKRARREARMASVRASREHEGAVMMTSRWPFACAAVCGRCGALAVPSATLSGDPMRREAVSTQTRGCTHCNTDRDTFIDLSNRDMARAFVDTEVLERELWMNRYRRIGMPLAATAVLGALATAAFVAAAPLVVGLTVTGGAMLRAATTYDRWQHHRTRRTHARRWSYAPAPSGPTTSARGHASGLSRRAPLSGRACIAYDVRVVWNGEDPTTPLSAALHEQSVQSLHVGGTDAGSAFLALTPRKLDTQEVLARPEAVRYLATRGLEPSDGAFDYYETLIVERDALCIETDETGRTRVTV